VSAATAPPATTTAAPAPAPAAAAGVPQLLTREQFVERVQGVLQTKTLSGVVAQVIELANSPRGDMSQLAKLISHDPMLSARVLQAANSAAYSGAGAIVTTPSDAIRKVGFNTVRNIAAALGVFQCMPEASADGFNPIWCWQHSFAVAQLCEKLALLAPALENEAGLAYVVGLCHDLGEIFIRTQFNKEYQQLSEALAGSDLSREALHQKMFGMTHGQMISAVLDAMTLPELIREPIEIIHSPGRARSQNPLARILWMSENYANAAMLASGPGSAISLLAQSFCKAAVGQPNVPGPDATQLRADVISMTVTLAKLSRADETRMMTPMFKPQKVRLWVAREHNVADFDPVGMALKSFAEIDVQNRLPLDREGEAYDGMVVLAPDPQLAGFSQREIDRVAARPSAKGRPLGILALTCDQPDTAEPLPQPWKLSVALSELAEFVEKLKQPAATRAA
jgi:HD-like signal output (HDOD) protein